MGKINTRRLGLGITIILIGIIVMVRSWTLVQPVTRLPDGRSAKLNQVSFLTNLRINVVQGPMWGKFLTPILPDILKKKILENGGILDLGTRSEPVLLVEMQYENINGSHGGIRIKDDQGNYFDNVTEGTSIQSGTNGATGFWPLSIAPRRTPALYIEPLFNLPGVGSTNLGPFKIKNPWFAKYPQWKAKIVPQSQTTDGLTLTLKQFRSGGVASPAALTQFYRVRERPLSRMTRLEFSFQENGSEVRSNFVYSIIISDATGNQWRHYPNHRTLGQSAWMDGNAFELQGTLWPGEDAWKIEVGVIHARGPVSESVIELPAIQLPGTKSFLELNRNSHALPDEIESIVFLTSPESSSPDWKWNRTGKPVYTIGVKLNKNAEEQLFQIVSATNQNGEKLGIAYQKALDGLKRIIMLDRLPETTSIHLKLALPEVRKVEFIARPEFVE